MPHDSSSPLRGLSHLPELNPQQREAVEHFQGPLLVLAGAGSGKTRVLTARICHLVRHHGVPPYRILSVTFTNKAAGEMKERIRKQLGEEPTGLWAGTFHSTGARILRRFAGLLGWSPTFTIYDQEQTLRQIKRAQEEAGIDPKRWSPKVFRSHISGAKNQLVSPQVFLEENGESFDILQRHVARVYPVYQEALKNHDAFDFDDLLVKPVELFENHPEILEDYRSRFSFLLVDEYQDTNRAQFRFLELLAGEAANLMVVGDDDQSIYAWRGADIRNILDFEASFPRASIVRLEENYRSTEKVLEAANQVIRHNVDRKGKNLRTRRKGGEAISVTETLDETDEARWIAGEIESALSQESGREHRSFSVLYRTNAQARALEDAFRVKGLPYQVVGGVGFYERREIQDVLGYLRLISNPRDGVAFDRVVGYPRRGVGSTTVARLRDWAREAGVTLLEGASRASEIPTLPKTGAKGLTEFADLIQRYSARASQAEVGVVLEELVEELDLLRLLREEGPDGDDRAENVKELIAAAMDFEAELLEEDDLPRDRFSDLDFFLQRVSLVADVDLHDPDADSVTLMTLHNAKGLEFPVVFISGMEDGLFPLGRAYDDPASLEEERRLFYVGITRAQDKLYLTHARQRRRAGEYMYGRLSPFVEAIDETLLEERVSSRVKRSFQTGFGVGFGRGAARGRRKERAQEEWDDSFPDEDLNQDLPRFVKGERVSHSTFGSGTVMEVSGFGPDLKVSVKFDSVGVKRLLARYADLEKDYF
ncbi:MAG: UvrD-helicase domain-containing protein [Gemmatimonadetes bacterium]|nr:UvrD-helicase domain-containing protein [Gemmatimonadota bacterium]